WGTAGNWSTGEVPGVDVIAPLSPTYDTVGQDVVIGTVGTATSASGIALDTQDTFNSSYMVVSIGSLTFNNSNPVDIFQLNSETLTVAGGIQNTTSVADDLSVPVTVG